MKAKIFNALKTSYSHLGLGDEILQLHAENLESTGLVTDDNLNVIIAKQSQYLANLQKLNDRRVNDAVAKTKKEAEDEAAKKKADEEAKAKAAAEEAAKKKAEEEAAAKKAAEEEAARKAAEEEAARQAEEMRKSELPESVKKIMEEQQALAKAQREAFEKQLKEMQEAAEASRKQMEEHMKKLADTNKTLKDGYEAMKSEADKAKADAAARHRSDYILNKAKELGIPQYRIDEGFVFAPDASEEAIADTLATVANNIKTNNLPNRPNAFPQTENGEISKEELKKIAQSLVR